MYFIIAVLLVGLMSVVTCYLVAKKRNANTTFWVAMAVLFGPLAIPFVFLAKSKDKA
ncbi:MAG: hypothetical protein OEU50_01220 [Gammaproteobacteria bacterium]|nr:hypothetical protein [Gammaproteobacteria bacterium]